MKRYPTPQNQGKFSGSLRHYHRSGGQNLRTWDDWVDGPSAKRKRSRNWLKILAMVIGFLALVGIAAGLWIEMG